MNIDKVGNVDNASGYYTVNKAPKTTPFQQSGKQPGVTGPCFVQPQGNGWLPKLALPKGFVPPTHGGPPPYLCGQNGSAKKS